MLVPMLARVLVCKQCFNFKIILNWENPNFSYYLICQTSDVDEKERQKIIFDKGTRQAAFVEQTNNPFKSFF